MMNSENLNSKNSDVENFGMKFYHKLEECEETASSSPSLSPRDESKLGSLFDSPEQSNQIRVEYGCNLKSKYVVELDETEVEIEFSPSFLEAKELPQCVTDIDRIQADATSLPTLCITDITDIRHLCNGSQSNIFKGNGYEFVSTNT